MKKLTKKRAEAILYEVLGRWPRKALSEIQSGRIKPTPPKTEQEKLCASGKCGHFSCAVHLASLEAELLKRRSKPRDIRYYAHA